MSTKNSRTTNFVQYFEPFLDRKKQEKNANASTITSVMNLTLMAKQPHNH